MPSRTAQVFINVPFDQRYRKLFDALVFTVTECGFTARCALETDDGSQVRLDKLYGIISDCRYGIHDISRVTLDSKHRLPRFNMPLELGIFLGAKRFGNSRQKLKSCLILERDLYRYQKYCSDISGQDVRAHGNDVSNAIVAVRNWLRTTGGGAVDFPGPVRIQNRYLLFRGDLPILRRGRDLDPRSLAFIDYRTLLMGWREENQ